MPTHTDTCILPYDSAFICDIVSDIERYPEFLPWCHAVEIVDRVNDQVIAKVTLGNDIFTESYRCSVKTERPFRIDVRYVEGPFKHLNTHWRFIECGTDGCKVDFFIDFEFQSSLFQMFFQKVFSSVVKSIMSAFIERAHKLYTERHKKSPSM